MAVGLYQTAHFPVWSRFVYMGAQQWKEMGNYQTYRVTRRRGGERHHSALSWHWLKPAIIGVGTVTVIALVLAVLVILHVILQN